MRVLFMPEVRNYFRELAEILYKKTISDLKNQRYNTRKIYLTI